MKKFIALKIALLLVVLLSVYFFFPRYVVTSIDSKKDISTVMKSVEKGEIEKFEALAMLSDFVYTREDPFFDGHGGIVGNIDFHCSGELTNPRVRAIKEIVKLDNDAAYNVLNEMASGKRIEECYQKIILKIVASIAAKNPDKLPRLFDMLDYAKPHHIYVKEILEHYERNIPDRKFTHKNFVTLIDEIKGDSKNYKNCTGYMGLVRFMYDDKKSNYEDFKKRMCESFSSECVEKKINTINNFKYALCEEVPELTES